MPALQTKVEGVCPQPRGIKNRQHWGKNVQQIGFFFTFCLAFKEILINSCPGLFVALNRFLGFLTPSAYFFGGSKSPANNNVLEDKAQDRSHLGRLVRQQAPVPGLLSPWPPLLGHVPNPFSCLTKATSGQSASCRSLAPRTRIWEMEDRRKRNISQKWRTENDRGQWAGKSQASTEQRE